MPNNVKKPKTRTRINIRLPPELVRWARSYARKQDTSFTGIVERALESMQEKANGRC